MPALTSVALLACHPLPPTGPALAPSIYTELNRLAELALARLAGVSGLMPSVDWLLYSAIRKEALLTSQIEGTQATLIDLFDEEAGFKVSNIEDVEEVTNYLRAFSWVQEQLRDARGLPIGVRLLCEAHRLLLDGACGAGKQPGELRRSQNWIGGTRPGNAAFVPPPLERVGDLLAQLEQFIHDDGRALPPLVKISLIHAQFETISPLSGWQRPHRPPIDCRAVGALGLACRTLDVPQRLPQAASGRVLPAAVLYPQRCDWEAWVSARHRHGATRSSTHDFGRPAGILAATRLRLHQRNWLRLQPSLLAGSSWARGAVSLLQQSYKRSPVAPSQETRASKARILVTNMLRTP